MPCIRADRSFNPPPVNPSQIEAVKSYWRQPCISSGKGSTSGNVNRRANSPPPQPVLRRATTAAGTAPMPCVHPLTGRDLSICEHSCRHGQIPADWDMGAMANGWDSRRLAGCGSDGLQPGTCFRACRAGPPLWQGGASSRGPARNGRPVPPRRGCGPPGPAAPAPWTLFALVRPAGGPRKDRETAG